MIKQVLLTSIGLIAELAFASGLSLAQAPAADPLNPIYMPVVDTNPSDYPANIWITDSLAKVLQNGGSPGTKHWITTYTTRNEIQSFQVHVQAGFAPVTALNVTMSDLVNSQTGSRISASSTDIIVYREAYQNVTISTATGNTFLNTTGRIPDILIPATDPYYHQKTNAFPFTVSAGNNQSIWVDVHTPAGSPPGYYSGTVKVSSGSTTLATMPVVYAVWGWQMPSTASLPSYTVASYNGFCLQVYGPAGCATYPGASGIPDYGATLSNVDAAVQMLDNRYSLSGITNIYPGTGSFATFDSIYGPLLSGTPAHVSTILPGAKLTSWSMALLSNQFTPAVFQGFIDHFAAKGWVSPLYGLVDEPNVNDPAVWTSLVTTGNLYHTYSTPPVINAVTTDIVNAGKYGALGAIDRLIVNVVTLDPGGGYPMQDLTTYQNWISQNPGKSFWAYQSCSSSSTCSNGFPGVSSPFPPDTYPNYDVDGTPVANRVMEWMTYLHGQTGELYYYIDICDVLPTCGYPFAGADHNPLTSNYYSGGWGDGTLMYPGSSSYVGTSIPIWLPSIRLKHIRDGMQDYEYLHALAGEGYASFVTAEAQSFITNTYTFNNDPAALQNARMALGTRLHQVALGLPAAPKVAPPVISSPASSNVTASSATISWTTDTPSDSQVSYGPTAALGQSSALQSTLTTSHSALLSSLAPSTLYHYRVSSRDALGSLSTSADNTFTTAAASNSAPYGSSGLVQHGSAHGLSIGLANRTTAGNLIAVSFSGDQGNYPIASITDTQGNTYVRAVTCFASGGANGEIWYASNIKGGIDTLSIHAAGGGNVGIAEFKGLATTNPLDTTKCNSSPAGPVYDTGSVTTRYNNDLLYAATVDGAGVPAAGAYYTLLDTATFNWEFGHEFRVAGVAGSYDASFRNPSTLSNGAIMLAAFKPASAAGTNTGNPYGARVTGTETGAIRTLRHAPDR